MTAHRTHILCLVIEKNRPVFYFVLVPRSPPLVLAIAKKLAVIFQSGLPFGPLVAKVRGRGWKPPSTQYNTHFNS